MAAGSHTFETLVQQALGQAIAQETELAIAQAITQAEEQITKAIRAKTAEITLSILSRFRLEFDHHELLIRVDTKDLDR